MKGRCPRPLDDGDVYDPRISKSFPSLSPVISVAKQLSSTKLASGGARRDRTVDLYTASVALSQLSYSPAVSLVTVEEGVMYG